MARRRKSRPTQATAESAERRANYWLDKVEDAEAEVHYARQARDRGWEQGAIQRLKLAKQRSSDAERSVYKAHAAEGFGGTVEQHREDAEGSYYQFTTAVADTNDSLASGDCRGAFGVFQEAAWWGGNAIAYLQAAEDGDRSQEKIESINSDLDWLKQQFRDACVVRYPSEKDEADKRAEANRLKRERLRKMIAKREQGED